MSDTHWILIVNLPSGGVHLEVPVLGLLLLKTGSFAGLTLTIKGTEFPGTLEQKDGQPSVKECGGHKIQLLLEKNHNKEPIEIAILAEVTVSLEETQELML